MKQADIPGRKGQIKKAAIPQPVTFHDYLIIICCSFTTIFCVHGISFNINQSLAEYPMDVNKLNIRSFI